MEFKTDLQEKILYIENKLDVFLPSTSFFPEEIANAMRYSVFAGGKRLRPVLLVAACEAVGGDVADTDAFACAIELIHTYSLIHDDLPAMDNDDYRRGKLTSHKKFGEALAILAGDALLHHAMEIMADACCQKVTQERVLAMQAIAHGAGLYGMLSGQVVDVQSEGHKIEMDTLEFIHKNKTAAMIQGALKAGAILGGANQTMIDRFDRAGEKIGVAFQIQDDILDVISTQDVLGKPIHSDEKNNKTTYVTMYGMKKSQEIVKELSDEAMEVWISLGKQGEFLTELTKHLIGRNH